MRQNSYTGLEDWGVIVEEVLSSNTEELFDEQTPETASLFNFCQAVAGDESASDADEYDIFLTPTEARLPSSSDSTNSDGSERNEESDTLDNSEFVETEMTLAAAVTIASKERGVMRN